MLPSPLPPSLARVSAEKTAVTRSQENRTTTLFFPKESIDSHSGDGSISIISDDDGNLLLGGVCD